jgi:glyoxylase-like metal-dependent hydrolase (beta-lactamase superfamily II)
VGFVTWSGPDRYVFIDPLIRDDVDARAWEAFDAGVSESERPAVLLTAPWHERSARAVAARYGGGIWVHPLGRVRLGDVPELDELPRGIELFVPAGVNEGQVAFHIVSERALVVGEFLVGAGGGLTVNPSPATSDPEAFQASLAPLRRLAVERVLVGHGAPILAGGSSAISLALDALT